MRILLAEDDRAIASGIEYSLICEGFEVVLCFNAKSAVCRAREGGIDLYLLDINLPDGSGYDICRAVREYGEAPVIFLTASDDEVNVVMGLDMGADDYITKPFRVRELISRIHTVLRRYKKTAQSNENFITVENIRIDARRAKVFKGGAEVDLTALEYRLLLQLACNLGLALTRAQLLEGIWDAAGSFVNDNTLTVYIKRLRDKLEEDPQNPRVIQTVRGIGYRMGGD